MTSRAHGRQSLGHHSLGQELNGLGTPDAEAGGEAAAKWKQHSMLIRDQLSLPARGTPGSSPWSTKANLRGVPNFARYHDLLDVCFLERSGEVDGVFCDLSQAVQRRPWGAHSARALTKGSLIYSFDHDAVLTRRSATRLQGFPTNLQTEGVSDEQLRHMAGEAVFLPNLASLLWAFWVDTEAPWHAAPGADSFTTPQKRHRSGEPAGSP